MKTAAPVRNSYKATWMRMATTRRLTQYLADATSGMTFRVTGADREHRQVTLCVGKLSRNPLRAPDGYAEYRLGVGVGEVWVDTVPPIPTMPTIRTVFPVVKRCPIARRKEMAKALLSFLGVTGGTKYVPAPNKVFTVMPPRTAKTAPATPAVTPAAATPATPKKRTRKAAPKAPKATVTPVPPVPVPAPVGTVTLSGPISADDRAVLSIIVARLGLHLRTEV